MILLQPIIDLVQYTQVMVKLNSTVWFNVDLRLFLLNHACSVVHDVITENNDDVSILVAFPYQ